MIPDLGGAGPLKVTIGTLPDEVLLETFTFYVKEAYEDTWITLVHVCRRWRCIVFASPLRLDLRLWVRSKGHVREMLESWPALPIVVHPIHGPRRAPKVTENVIAALEHRDRVCRIILDYFPVPAWKLKRFLEVMQHPFPALTHLELFEWYEEVTPVIPDSFLGGSAPLLQSLRMIHPAFPALPNLLLSANHLVDLQLYCFAHAGHTPPEVMAASLSSMTKLQSLKLRFGAPRPRPSRASRRPPPRIRTTLPALTKFSVEGVSEYVEDLVARIDAPLLDDIHISFFNQLIFDIPQLSYFINRVEKFDGPNAKIWFRRYHASVELSSGIGPYLYLLIWCRQADWQLSSIAQVCGMSLHPISTLENLTVAIDDSIYHSQHLGPFDIERSQWEELLYPFTNVKNLYLAEEVGLHAATALQGLVCERVTQVLPALQSLWIKGLQPSGPTREAAESFVAARQRLGRPITIHCWEVGETEYGSFGSKQPEEPSSGLEWKGDSEWESSSDSEIDD